MLSGRLSGVLFWSVLGALTRETLLILPGVFFLVSQRSIGERSGPLLGAIGVHVALRAVLGVDGYQLTKVENWAEPLTIPISLFFILGFSWVAVWRFTTLAGVNSTIALVLSALRVSQNAPPDHDETRIRFLGCASLVLVLLLLSHVFMGRITEIRTSSLISPWVLVFLSGFCASGVVRLTRRTLCLSVLFLIVVAALEGSGLASMVRDFLISHSHGFSSRIWFAEFYLQIFLMIWVGKTLSGQKHPIMRPQHAAHRNAG